MDKIDCLLTQFPLYSEELKIDLTTPSGRFKWFLASILFGARISERIASNTYREFDDAGIDSPDRILSAGWDELVRLLDAGGYVRYDFSTATKLLAIMKELKDRYGDLEELYRRSSGTEDLENKLREFKGIGPVTTQIFLRELRGVWKVNPEVSGKAKKVAQCIGIDPSRYEGEKLSRIESALIKIYIRFCKRKKCAECSVAEFCFNSRGERTRSLS
jgi:endonuclease III